MTTTTMDSEDTFVKRWPVQVLTWSNSSLWFPHMKQWLSSKESWSAVKTQIPATGTPDSSALFLLNTFGLENQKTNMRALYWLNTCCCNLTRSQWSEHAEATFLSIASWTARGVLYDLWWHWVTTHHCRWGHRDPPQEVSAAQGWDCSMGKSTKRP